MRNPVVVRETPGDRLAPPLDWFAFGFKIKLTSKFIISAGRSGWARVKRHRLTMPCCQQPAPAIRWNPYSSEPRSGKLNAFAGCSSCNRRRRNCIACDRSMCILQQHNRFCRCRPFVVIECGSEWHRPTDRPTLAFSVYFTYAVV